MTTCRHDDCDKPARADGWCTKHYQRIQRHGHPDVTAYTASIWWTRTPTLDGNYTIRCGDCGHQWGKWTRPAWADNHTAEQHLGATWARLDPHPCGAHR